MYSFELFLTTVLLLVANGVDTGPENDSNLVATSAELALESINEAQFAGADVYGLVDRYNLALNLTDQADNGSFSSCSSHDDCNEKAVTIFVTLIDDADLLKEQARTASALQKLMNVSIYAPVTSFVTALVGYWSFKTWKSRRNERFLAMEIKVKQE
jgi:hypothetical protein